MRKDSYWPGSSSELVDVVDNGSESWGSSEDFESPRSGVEERRPKAAWLVHSQVLRIKEEDLQLGEDHNKVVMRSHHRGGGDAALTGRPVLPCSPLGRFPLVL